MKRNGEHFVTCGQMKVLERRADENGLSYYQMMENAGTGAASIIMDGAAYWKASKEDVAAGGGILKAASSIYEADGLGDVAKAEAEDAYKPVESAPMKVYVFCGKGNNGGDGFVTARIMSDNDYDVTVILVDGEPKTEDAITNFKLLRDRDVKIVDMITNPAALMELKGAPDLIIDAIYGTGFKGELKGNGLKAAIYINSYSKGEYGERTLANVMVAALDIPSGMGGDLIERRELDPNSVVAHLTITFHAKKPVHLQKFAEAHCGDIKVVDIGIDEDKLWNIEI